jgi:hypothetical protein
MLTGRIIGGEGQLGKLSINHHSEPILEACIEVFTLPSKELLRLYKAGGGAQLQGPPVGWAMG